MLIIKHSLLFNNGYIAFGFLLFPLGDLIMIYKDFGYDFDLSYTTCVQ